MARLWGLLTTYRRPEHLVRTLGVLARQTRRVDTLLIVDNGGDAETTVAAELAQPTAAPAVHLLATSGNIGPAGGIAAGMRWILERAADDDWIVTFDDDDPPKFDDTLQRLWTTADELLRRDCRCGAVGVVGSQFNSRRAALRRVPDSELRGGPLGVTTLGGGHCPLIRVAAIEDAGTYDERLFFGHEELDFFLRLRRRGWSVYSDTSLHRRDREAAGRSGLVRRRSSPLGDADWRRYYSIRNRVHVARTYCGPVATAAVIGEVSAHVVLELLQHPRKGSLHVPLTAQACADGLLGRLGIRRSPQDGADGRLPLRPGKGLSRSARA